MWSPARIAVLAAFAVGCSSDVSMSQSASNVKTRAGVSPAFQKGLQLIADEDYSAAVAAFDEAIAADSKDYKSYAHRGAARLATAFQPGVDRKQIYEMALADAKKCLELNPAYVPGLWLRAGVADWVKRDGVMMSEDKAAKAAADAAFQADPNLEQTPTPKLKKFAQFIKPKAPN